ncbi:MAG TPA: VOC family protein [Candidatus Acidoferrum sp.]|nr:VOC family protein [Candidatus Acidoferrum sp.]
MADSEAAAKGTAKAQVFGGVNPIFRVRDLQASIDYYVNALGFKADWGGADFASVSRDRCHIFLCVGDQGHFGTWVWIGVEDVEVLLDEIRAKGAKVRHEPSNYGWAYEMQIEDLDGNVLRIGSEPREDKPTGDWLDMNGDTWRKLPDGSHTRVARAEPPGKA